MLTNNFNKAVFTVHNVSWTFHSSITSLFLALNPQAPTLSLTPILALTTSADAQHRCSALRSVLIYPSHQGMTTHMQVMRPWHLITASTSYYAFLSIILLQPMPIPFNSVSRYTYSMFPTWSDKVTLIRIKSHVRYQIMHSLWGCRKDVRHQGRHDCPPMVLFT